MAFNSRNSRQSSSIWPGYVDVLSALLMVVIFVLLIFTFSQFLFSYILSDQNSELESLHSRIAEISRLLGLEKSKNEVLTNEINALGQQVDSLIVDRARLRGEIEDINNKRVEDKNQLEAQLRTIASLQQDIDALRQVRQQLETEIAQVTASLTEEQQLTKSLRDRSKALEARLASEMERTLLAQQDIENRDIHIQALSALIGEQQENLDKQQRLTADVRAEVALLNDRIELLQSQLREVRLALSKSEEVRQEQAEEIEDLGERLNIELARKVNELERYKSDFFGRLRQVIGDNPYVHIEGDRFLLQAELLFSSGTAELGEPGMAQLRELAKIVNELIPSIPNDLQWILRVDGHTDRVPIRSSKFSSNWELSTVRAVSVVRFLADQGIPEGRMAATGFSKFHPIDPADTSEAYRKNRRIEIKLTSR
ncbi:MAG: OmpA family protein [Desulfocapsaceae bacterium]|nr:OmpA family protein [Desulfocapsaceae bacterium]